MNRLYLSALLLFILFAASCSSNGDIRIENINNKQQLDSLLATLPKAQVKIDSVPVRVLHIQLKGAFTYYGQPVTNVEIETKDEMLSRFMFNTEKGALDVLNALENENGTGIKEHASPDLTWKTTGKNIQFGVPEYQGNLLNLSNKEKAVVFLYFNNPVSNRITNIYKSQQPSATQNNYKLEVDNDECGYRIYVNGFLAVEYLKARTMGVTVSINQYLVKGKQQQITVEVLPGKDFDGNPRTRLELESVVHVTMSKWSEVSNQSPEVLNFYTASVDTSIFLSAHSSKAVRASRFYGQTIGRTERSFEIDPVPYELPCYAEATDIRKVPDAKEKILAHYHKLQDAYLKKDLKQLESLLYPYEQNKIAAFYLSKPTDGQEEWTNIVGKAQKATGAKLEENVSLYITPDGRFAKLIPAVESKNPAFYLEDAENIYPLDYYICLNKNGEVQFALN